MSGVSIIGAEELTPLQVGLLISGAADAVAAWYLDQWAEGLDPACCAKCAGARYKPDKISQQVVIDLADEVMHKMRGSCQSVAAMHTGHKRAELIQSLLDQGEDAEDAWAEARRAFKIGLERQQGNYFHVYSIDNGERHDATVGMKT